MWDEKYEEWKSYKVAEKPDRLTDIYPLLLEIHNVLPFKPPILDVMIMYYCTDLTQQVMADIIGCSQPYLHHQIKLGTKHIVKYYDFVEMVDDDFFGWLKRTPNKRALHIVSLLYCGNATQASRMLGMRYETVRYHIVELKKDLNVPPKLLAYLNKWHPPKKMRARKLAK